MTLSTFADLGKVFGVSQRQRRNKPFYCRKCGAEMYHPPGTNIFLCENKTSDGKECGNRVFTAKAF